MPAAGGNPSLGELGRRLDRIESKLDALNFVHPETLDTKLLLVQAHEDEHERRIAALEAANAEREKEAAANRRAIALAFLASFALPVASALILNAVK